MAFPDGWQRRAALAIQSSQVGETLTNFPVLLTRDTLPSEMFDADGSFPAQNGGGDIRFSSDSAGNTQLPCEVVSFVTDNDPANGSAEIWVKVPSVSSSADTSIYVWYSTAGTDLQPAVTDTYGRNAVWANYALVTHFQSDPSGSAPQIVDSTGNGNDGTTSGTMTSGDLVASKVGNGVDFDGADDYVNFGTNASLDVDTGSFTVQAWATQSPVLGELEGNPLLHKKSTAGVSDNAADIIFEISGSGRYAATANNQVIFGFGTGTAAVTHNSASTVGTTATLIHGVFDRGNQLVQIYINGSQDISEAQTLTPQSNSHPVIVAAHFSGAAVRDFVLDGVLDELRLSGAPLSANWISAEYANQNAPATFVIEGTPESVHSGPTPPFTSVTISQ